MTFVNIRYEYSLENYQDKSTSEVSRLRLEQYTSSVFPLIDIEFIWDWYFFYDQDGGRSKSSFYEFQSNTLEKKHTNNL